MSRSLRNFGESSMPFGFGGSWDRARAHRFSPVSRVFNAFRLWGVLGLLPRGQCPRVRRGSLQCLSALGGLGMQYFKFKQHFFMRSLQCLSALGGLGIKSVESEANNTAVSLQCLSALGGLGITFHRDTWANIESLQCLSALGGLGIIEA